MNSLEAALRVSASHLERLHRHWAVIGGLAVSAHTEPRTTRDVDLVVAVRDDPDAEALVFALSAVGFRVEATHLLDRVSPAEIGEARAALDLITARGFDRGKSLQKELDDLLAGS